MKQLTNQNKKPSPTRHPYFPDSARNSEISKKGGNRRLSIKFCFIEGTSLPAFLFQKVHAGMTVEASVVLPLFLFFFLNMGCAIEMIRLHGNLQLALWQVGNKISIYGYALGSGEMLEDGAGEDEWRKNLAGMAFASTYVRAQVIESVGKEYLNQSPLKRGADSLQFWESDIFGAGDVIDLVVTYSVSPWSSLAGVASFRMANRYYGHIWNGYQLPGENAGSGTQIVFITENVSVYHLNRNCTYLQLSVRQISAWELEGARNQYGGRYHACEMCTGNGVSTVLYIAEKGDCYHSVRECPGLKRTVYSISLKEAAEYRPCSRCGWKTEQED